MNALEIIIILVTLGFAVAGYRKGFVRKLASLLSLVISVVLVSMFLPYVADFLKDRTPVYDFIVRQCRQVVEQQVSSVIGSGSIGDSALDAYRGMGKEEIRSLMVQNGYDRAIVDSLTEEQLEDYKSQFIQQYAARYLAGDQSLAGQLDSYAQEALIEKLPLPKVFREQLAKNNNAEGYQELGVDTFQEYVVHFSANVILNVVSFIAALLLVQIAFRMAVAALDILSHIPVLGGLNRLAGLLLGLLQALFLLWIFFMALSAFSATETGLYLMSMVQESRLLSYLYDSNFFMQIVLQTAAMFL